MNVNTTKIENKIPNITNPDSKFALNTKSTEVENKTKRCYYYSWIENTFRWKKRATLVDSFLESVKLTKNSDHDKYRYSRCGIRFNTRSIFSINVELGKNANGFGTNVSTNVYHCILIIGKMIS